MLTPETQHLVLAVAGGAASAIGLSKLVEVIWMRWFRRKDEADAEQIKFDQTALQVFHTEIQNLKTEVGNLREQANSHAMQNSELKIENRHLAEINRRQSIEIDELREKERTLTQQILELTNLTSELRAKLERLEKRSDG